MNIGIFENVFLADLNIKKWSAVVASDAVMYWVCAAMEGVQQCSPEIFQMEIQKS